MEWLTALSQALSYFRGARTMIVQDCMAHHIILGLFPSSRCARRGRLAVPEGACACTEFAFPLPEPQTGAGRSSRGFLA